MTGSPTFSSKELRKAIKTLEPILGRINVDALLYGLEIYDLRLTNGHKEYDLVEIQSALERIFGKEATSPLLRHITLDLFETK